jgi:hypothetical protein
MASRIMSPRKEPGAKSRAAAPHESSTPRQRIRPETRAQMLERLTNPQISLHETSVILRKGPATIRDYCDAGWLPHERTAGNQRRFYLRDVLAFLRAREAEKKRQ